MTHQELGGLLILTGLVLLIIWVGVLRWRGEALPPRGLQPGFLPGAYIPPAPAPSKPGSPCRASGCPAMRYAPLDEHAISAHHAYDNQKVRT